MLFVDIKDMHLISFLYHYFPESLKDLSLEVYWLRDRASRVGFLTS